MGLLSAMIILSATQLKNKDHLHKLWNMHAKSQGPLNNMVGIASKDL